MESLTHRYAEHRVQLPSLHPVLPLANGQTLYGFSAEARQTLDWWQRLRPLAAATGHWPLIIEPETPHYIREISRGVLDEYLGSAANLDGQALLAQQSAWLGGDRAWRREARRALAGRGKWPQEPTRHTLADLPTVSYGWYRTMLVTFFPVEASWQIPCLTGYGDWNGYPEPAEHAAIEFMTYNEGDYYGQTLVAVAASLLDAEVWLAWWD